MPMSTNIHSYSDVAAVLTQALPAGRATYRLATPGAARHWAQRANKYRLLLQKQATIKGIQTATPYDRMKLSVNGSAVEINFNPQPAGELSLPGGKVVRPTIEQPPIIATSSPSFSPRTVLDNDLSEAAAALLAEHGDDET